MLRRDHFKGHEEILSAEQVSSADGLISSSELSGVYEDTTTTSICTVAHFLLSSQSEIEWQSSLSSG